VNVRPASVADIEYCARLDPSYDTDYVWQLEETALRGSLSVSMQRVRLPRRLDVAYPYSAKSLGEDLAQGACVLVAEDSGMRLGYLSLAVRPLQERGWLQQLVVHRPYRRLGIATLLLQTAQRWAREMALRAVVAEMQTKNDPAVCFYTQRGFSFCGFIDHHYPNGDIGLFYAANL
jgi:ribosomal protein S18 acetylase RimI-like enzyme